MYLCPTTMARRASNPQSSTFPSHLFSNSGVSETVLLVAWKQILHLIWYHTNHRSKLRRKIWVKNINDEEHPWIMIQYSFQLPQFPYIRSLSDLQQQRQWRRLDFRKRSVMRSPPPHSIEIEESSIASTFTTVSHSPTALTIATATAGTKTVSTTTIAIVLSPSIVIKRWRSWKRALEDSAVKDAYKEEDSGALTVWILKGLHEWKHRKWSPIGHNRLQLLVRWMNTKDDMSWTVRDNISCTVHAQEE